jgi:peptide subunit release factor 1 (eRF1)
MIMTLITQPNVSAILAKTSTVRYLNQYRCPTCQTEWEDEWDCGCNDRCPDCNKEIEPYESALIAGESAETELPCDGLSLANAMPEVLGKPAMEIQS